MEAPEEKLYTNHIYLFYDDDTKTAYAVNLSSGLHLNTSALKHICQYINQIVENPEYAIVVIHEVLMPARAVTLTIMEHTDESKTLAIRKSIEKNQLKDISVALLSNLETHTTDGVLQAHVIEVRYDKEEDILNGNIVFVNNRKKSVTTYETLSSFCSFISYGR